MPAETAGPCADGAEAPRTTAEGAAVAAGLATAHGAVLHPDLTVTFEASAKALGEKERRVVAAAGRAHKKAGGREIRIYAGAGSTGNPFDQMVVAQNRARHVRTLLPTDMLLLVEYDPSQDEDTVRIEFVQKS